MLAHNKLTMRNETAAAGHIIIDMAADSGRLILGPVAPIGASLRRLMYISEAPQPNIALPPNMRTGAEPGDRRDF